jgi:hypothetical protein
MGTRTGASIELYPFNRDALSSTAAGIEFLRQYDAVVEWHEHEDAEITDGHLTVELYDVNYGTAQFDEERLPALAMAAGLWYRDSDAGGGTWTRHQRTFFPNGETIDIPIVSEYGPTLSRGDFRTIAAVDSTESSLEERVEAYFELGSAPLPALAAKAGDGSLARLMANVGMKPVGPGDLERPVETSELGPPDPPMPVRGPGSNQYQDKPPRQR